MVEARQGKEIVIRIRNKIGLLAEIAKLIAEKGISVLAASGTVTGDDSVIRLITDDNLRAREMLAEHNYAPQEEGVILLDLPHKPGMLKAITEVLAWEEIDIQYIYVTADARQEQALVVLHTSNDEHALPRLRRL